MLQNVAEPIKRQGDLVDDQLEKWLEQKVLFFDSRLESEILTRAT